MKGREALLSTQAAAAWLAVDTHRLIRWRQDGSGPPFIRLPDNRVRYDRRDLDAWALLRRRSLGKQMPERDGPPPRDAA